MKMKSKNNVSKLNRNGYSLKVGALMLNPFTGFSYQIMQQEGEKVKRHYFIALPLPDEVKQFLQEKVELLKKQLPFQRWVHREDFHLTLAFLGDCEPDKLAECWRDCEIALQNERCFLLQLNEFGIFGRRDQPRIFWSAPMPEERLIMVQAAVAAACKKNNFALDERPFRPHITLARKYRDENPFTEEKLQSYQSMLNELPPFYVKEVALFETRMDQEPKYAIKEQVYLK